MLVVNSIQINKSGKSKIRHHTLLITADNERETKLVNYYSNIEEIACLYDGESKSNLKLCSWRKEEYPKLKLNQVLICINSQGRAYHRPVHVQHRWAIDDF
jgi:hypothetical protein